MGQPASGLQLRCNAVRANALAFAHCGIECGRLGGVLHPRPFIPTATAMERQTRQRQAILNALRESGRSLSPPEIQVLAQRSVTSLSLSTVYRQIKAMQVEGQVTAVELPGLPPRYELPLAAVALDCPPDCHADGEHHHDAHGHVAVGRAPAVDRHRHHFHCTGCDEVTPIEGCPGGIDALAPSGWQVERHDLTLHGRCGKCVASRPKTSARRSAEPQRTRMRTSA